MFVSRPLWLWSPHSKHLRQLLFQYCCTSHPRIQQLSVTPPSCLRPCTWGPAESALSQAVGQRGWRQLWVGFGSAHVSHFCCAKCVLSSQHQRCPGDRTSSSLVIPWEGEDLVSDPLRMQILRLFKSLSQPSVSRVCICWFNQSHTVNTALDPRSNLGMCSLGRGRAAVHFPLCCPSTTLQESQVATPNVRGSEEASPEREELENDTARGADW